MINRKSTPPSSTAPREEEVRNGAAVIVVNAEPVTDPYGPESNTNVPFAEATSIPVDADGGGSTTPTAYYTGGASSSSPSPSPIAVSTGAPIIRAPQSHGLPVQRQRRGGNNAANRAAANDRGGGCCARRSPWCVICTVLAILLVCLVLPIIVLFAVGVMVVANIDENDEFWGDDAVLQDILGFDDDDGATGRARTVILDLEGYDGN
eukprot:CAMPEP_0197181898 /NCGR_PEP_ID=MMETSP1423-20130617/6046_1 /TAXON_ID=476441 /ORGANISM="Pseudo-nitzschia heimii, Strain UNC1101" /LENGTH=206 /DNA_ID=CAMNT_0042632241 /DNA_START=72 /DNA_END=693 /DNA_ORIENTATION=-